MLRTLLAYVVLSLLVAPVVGQEQSRASDLLRRMIRAEMTQKLSGTRVVINNLEGRNERVIEQVLRSGPDTRVEFPKGSPRYGEVMVERGARRWHWVPSENTIYVGESKRREKVEERLPRVLDGIRRGSLKVETGEAARVAGRKCTELLLKRKDGANVWRLYIDDATGVLLKQQIMDPSNPDRVIGGFEYTQVDFDINPSPEDFVIKHPGAKIVQDDFVPLEDAQKRVPFRILRPNPTPAGLRLAGAKPVELGGKPGVHLLYHDAQGMDPISVFQVRGTIPRDALGRLRHREFRMATRQAGEVFLAAMGKLTQERLQSFIDSFR